MHLLQSFADRLLQHKIKFEAIWQDRWHRENKTLPIKYLVTYSPLGHITLCCKQWEPNHLLILLRSERCILARLLNSQKLTPWYSSRICCIQHDDRQDGIYNFKRTLRNEIPVSAQNIYSRCIFLYIIYWWNVYRENDIPSRFNRNICFCEFLFSGIIIIIIRIDYMNNNIKLSTHQYWKSKLQLFNQSQKKSFLNKSLTFLTYGPCVKLVFIDPIILIKLYNNDWSSRYI